jgi:cyclase
MIMGTGKIVSFILLLFISYFASFAQPSEPGPVKLEKLADNVFEIQGGRGANGGLFIGDDGVIIIDSKMDKQSVDQIMAEISKLTDKPVKFLINTHSDGDHVNGNPFFPESAIIVAHQKCREEFFLPGRDGSPSMWLTPDLSPYLPQVTFTDKMDLYSGNDKIELWYFGRGHTSGDIVVNFPEHKVAFIGDQIFMNRVPLIHLHKGGNSHSNVVYLEKMLDTIDAEKFSSGHSEVVGRDDIRNYISTMKARQSRVAGFIEKGYTLEQIKSEFSEGEAALTETIYYELIGE